MGFQVGKNLDNMSYRLDGLDMKRQHTSKRMSNGMSGSLSKDFLFPLAEALVDEPAVDVLVRRRLFGGGASRSVCAEWMDPLAWRRAERRNVALELADMLQASST